MVVGELLAEEFRTRHRRNCDRCHPGQFNRLQPLHQRTPTHTNTHHLQKLWDQNHFSVNPDSSQHPETLRNHHSTSTNPLVLPLHNHKLMFLLENSPLPRSSRSIRLAAASKTAEYNRTVRVSNVGNRNSTIRSAGRTEDFFSNFSFTNFLSLSDAERGSPPVEESEPRDFSHTREQEEGTSRPPPPSPPTNRPNRMQNSNPS